MKSIRLSKSARALIVLCALVSCGPSAEEEQAARAESLRAARADSMAQASAMFDASAFDTIAWVAADSALARGETVYRFSCQRCHGFTGHGDGDLATEHGIVMPDLTVDDWPYDGDVPAIRERVFVGHDSEMPNWGLHGLSYRDIDAVSSYLLEEIRGQ
ncbi:MAG: c-type cytochrome [Gemmatimonadota bacterium]|nr:c-type cytochrome [Gemmatimonadota bacterium]